MTKNARLVREHDARKGQLGANPIEIRLMTRRVAAIVALILAALALPATGGSRTENTFCDIESEAVCADVVIQKEAQNTCTTPPETVLLSGTIHVAVFQDENQFRIHTNWQDMRGVALVTGTIYQANEATRLYEVQRPSGSSTFVLQDERELVSQGSGDNFILREYFQITVYPDPTKPPTIKEHGETKCTG
jgi:hypothetical protein